MFVKITVLSLLFALASAQSTADDALVGFWPLTNFDKLRDISPNGYNGAALGDGKPSSDDGPFGDVQTHYEGTSYTGRNAGIIDVKLSQISPRTYDGLTISFLARLGNLPGATYTIAQFYPRALTTQACALEILHDENNNVRIGGGCQTEYITFPKTISRSWEYYGISISKRFNNCSATLFGRYGQKTRPIEAEWLCTALSNSGEGFRMGAGQAGNGYDTLLSCLTLHNRSLTESEVTGNYDKCRVALGQSQCGSTRLPLSNVPNFPSIQAKYGQFPWVATIRSKPNRTLSRPYECAATILDRFWLLTSASCFTNSSIGTTVPTDYLVYTGDFNTGADDSNENKENVDKIIFAPKTSTFSDVALVVLQGGMKLSNPYINNVCFNVKVTPPADTTASEVFVGWGENGRGATVSRTEQRYIWGHSEASSQCRSYWGLASNDPALCFSSDDSGKSNVPCNGDAGSPTVIARDSNDNRLALKGIFSKRNGDCTGSSLFTSFQSAWGWIKSQIACANPQLNDYPTQCPV